LSFVFAPAKLALSAWPYNIKLEKVWQVFIGFLLQAQKNNAQPYDAACVHSFGEKTLYQIA